MPCAEGVRIDKVGYVDDQLSTGIMYDGIIPPYNGSHPIVFDNGWSKPSVPKPVGYKWWDKGIPYDDPQEENKKIQPEELHNKNTNYDQYMKDTPKIYDEAVQPYKVIDD